MSASCTSSPSTTFRSDPEAAPSTTLMLGAHRVQVPAAPAEPAFTPRPRTSKVPPVDVSTVPPCVPPRAVMLPWATICALAANTMLPPLPVVPLALMVDTSVANTFAPRSCTPPPFIPPLTRIAPLVAAVPALATRITLPPLPVGLPLASRVPATTTSLEIDPRPIEPPLPPAGPALALMLPSTSTSFPATMRTLPPLPAMVASALMLAPWRRAAVSVANMSTLPPPAPPEASIRLELAGLAESPSTPTALPASSTLPPARLPPLTSITPPLNPSGKPPMAMVPPGAVSSTRPARLTRVRARSVPLLTMAGAVLPPTAATRIRIWPPSAEMVPRFEAMPLTGVQENSQPTGARSVTPAPVMVIWVRPSPKKSRVTCWPEPNTTLPPGALMFPVLVSADPRKPMVPPVLAVMSAELNTLLTSSPDSAASKTKRPLVTPALKLALLMFMVDAIRPPTLICAPPPKVIPARLTRNTLPVEVRPPLMLENVGAQPPKLKQPPTP